MEIKEKTKAKAQKEIYESPISQILLFTLGDIIATSESGGSSGNGGSDGSSGSGGNELGEWDKLMLWS